MALNAPSYGQDDSGGPRVQAGILPVARMDPNAPLEAFGGGALPEQQFKSAGEIGNAVTQGADMAQRLALQEQYQQDHTQTLAANLKADDLRSTLTEQLAQLHGPDAITQAPKLSDQFTQGLQEIKGFLTPRQQEMFEGLQQSQIMDFGHTVKTHVLQENAAWTKEVQAGTVNNLITDSGQNPDDTARILANRNIIKATAAAGAAKAGAQFTANGDGTYTAADAGSANVLGREMLEATSGLHLAVIQADVNNGNVRKATNWFNQYKDEIDPRHYEAVDTWLREGGTRVDAQNIVNQAMNRFATVGSVDDAGQNAKDFILGATQDQATQQLALNQFQSQAAARERQESDVRAQATAKAVQYVQKNGVTLAQTGFDPVTWAGFDDNQRATLQRMATLQSPTGALVKTDDKAFADYASLKPADIVGLSEGDLMSKYVSRMSKGDGEIALSEWKAGREGVTNPKLLSAAQIKTIGFQNFKQINNVESGVQTPAQLDDDAKASYGKFMPALQSAVDTYEKVDLGGKRIANSQEVQKIADDLSIKTSYDGMFGWPNSAPNVHGYEDETLNQIPPYELQGIVAAMRQSGKIQPTSANIRAAFTALHAGDNNAP